jgi:hypothetical protein
LIVSRKTTAFAQFVIDVAILAGTAESATAVRCSTKFGHVRLAEYFCGERQHPCSRREAVFGFNALRWRSDLCPI